LVLNSEGVGFFVFTIISLFLSLVCLRLYLREKREIKMISFSGSTDPSILSFYTATIMACYGFACGGLFVMMYISIAPVVVSYALGFGIIAACVILGLVLLITHRRFIAYERTLRITFFVIAVVTLLYPVLPETPRIICLIVVVAIFGFLGIANWTTLSIISTSHNVCVPYHFLRGKFHFSLGILIGWAFSSTALGFAFFPQTLSEAQIAMVILILLLLTAVASPFGRDVLTIVASEDKESQKAALPVIEVTDTIWSHACSGIAKDYGLTPREQEVLSLLSKGRNANAIARELNISTATAKSHIYHIYHKIGVTSHQTLIDHVEAVVKEQYQ